MVCAIARGSFVSPSFRPQGCRRPLSFPAGPSGLRYHGQRTPLPLLCTAYTLDPLGGDEPVDVIGIGSRKDSIIDFCLASPAVSASRFRFWTIYSRDKKMVQLLERCRSKDVVIRNVEFPLSPYSYQPAAILVASAGHGLDHIAAVDLLSNIKSVGGLAIAIVLKPFSFEGQTRHKEVNDLVNRLKSCSNFYTVVEADSFFKAEVGTLAEALESANNTALLAMNTISSMIFRMHLKILNTPEGKVKDVKPSEVVKILESYGEVKIYHGAGYSVNAAITQAIFHCPFYDAGLKDFNGLTIMTLTSACNIDESDLRQIIPSFRRITGYTGEIIFSETCEPNLEPKLVVATLLIMGYNEKMVTQNKGLLCELLQNLPFFSHFFRVDSLEASGAPSNSSLGDRFLSSGSGSTSVLNSTKVAYPFDLIPNQVAFPDKLESALLRKDSCHETIGRAAEPAEANHASLSKCRSQNSGEELGIKMAKHSIRDIGPAFHIAQLWAKKCSASRTKKKYEVDTFSLPVGVKSSKLSPDCTPYSNHILAENSDYTDQEISGGIAADMCKKDSLLSVRAAMMLEAERESLKSWNPVVEIQYRGGIYKGRCQGSLPDGKGRLTSMDGSFYDGFWKCGKRSGLGTFCYSNGDLFRGPWRDDFMHGKGWFYFHTGDRWFANFGRGKANGEGRFFSKNGSVFFGFFRDGWRHGQSICIDVDGSRWTELWDDGVLINRTPLDKEANI